MNAMAAMIPIKIQTSKTALSDKGSGFQSTEEAAKTDQSFAGILSAARESSPTAKNSSAKGKANSDDSKEQADSPEQDEKDKKLLVDGKGSVSSALLGTAPIIGGSLSGAIPQVSTVGAGEKKTVIQTTAAVNGQLKSPARGIVELLPTMRQGKNAASPEGKNSIVGQQLIAMDRAVVSDSAVSQQQPQATGNAQISTVSQQQPQASGNAQIPTVSQQQPQATGNAQISTVSQQQPQATGNNDPSIPFQLVKQEAAILPKAALTTQQFDVTQAQPTEVIGGNQDLVVSAVAANGEQKESAAGQKQTVVDQKENQPGHAHVLSVSMATGSNATLAKDDDLKNSIFNEASTVIVKNSTNANDTAYQDGGQLTGQKEHLPGQNTDSLSDSNSASTTAFQGLLDQQNITGKIAMQSANPSQPDQNSVHDPYDITSQIVQQAHLLKNGHNSEMIIQLKPEHLGELTLKVAVENGTVSTTFHSGNAEVRSMLESAIPQLKQEMADQGIKIDYVGVSAQLGQSFSDGSRENFQQQPTMKSQNKRQPVSEEFIQAVEAAGSPQSSAAASGVDYRI
ncbi:MAG: flagellar hook-length control protein FliK [Veillonellales bacterium]